MEEGSETCCKSGARQQVSKGFDARALESKKSFLVHRPSKGVLRLMFMYIFQDKKIRHACIVKCTQKHRNYLNAYEFR